MEGTSVLDQNKPKPAAEAPASVLSQPAPKATGGDQSVLGGGASANHKPITFYKKAWFWIIIAVVVLGIAGLVVFLVIQANLTAEAIEKYTANASAADSASRKFDGKYWTAYSKSGLAGYYDKDNKRSVELRNKCLDELGVSSDEYEAARDIKIMNGEKAAEELGTGETRKLSEGYKKVAEALKDPEEAVKKCEDILKSALEGDYELTIGEFTVDDTTSKYYVSTSLPIKIKNKSDDKLKFYIKINAVDAKGNIIGYDTLYTDVIASGESYEDEIFDYGYRSKIEEMKAAKFKVVEVSERAVN